MKRIEKFENQMRICRDVELMVLTNKMNYMDAAILYAEEHELEIEFVANILSTNAAIRSKIEEEAEDLNFLKKRARLPIP